MRNRVRFVLTSFVGSAVLLGMLCGAVRLRAQDQTWLAKNDRGTRFEGLVDRPNARRDYEVLGLFGYRSLPSQLSQSDKLTLMYYVPKDDRVASIVVKELQSETQYLMKPKLQPAQEVPDHWNTFGEWPVNAVILPNHVALDNLGVLVRLQDRVDGMLSPALLFVAGKPQILKEYALDFVSHRSLKSLTCTVIPESGKSRACGAGQKALEESIPIEFAIPATGLPDGRVTVRIEGAYANSSETMSAEVHFIHHDLAK